MFTNEEVALSCKISKGKDGWSWKVVRSDMGKKCVVAASNLFHKEWQDAVTDAYEIGKLLFNGAPAKLDCAECTQINLQGVKERML